MKKNFFFLRFFLYLTFFQSFFWKCRFWKKFVEKSTFFKLCPYFWFFCENREKCRYHPKVHSKQRGKSQNNRVVPITFVENHPFFKVLDNFEPFLALIFSTLGWHLQFYCFFLSTFSSILDESLEQQNGEQNDRNMIKTWITKTVERFQTF